MRIFRSLFSVVALSLLLVFESTAAPATKPSAIDKRAVALFDRAIIGLKKHRSFSLAAEEYFLDTSVPQKRFASGSLQWPYRAKLDISGKEVESRALVGRDYAFFWNGANTTKIPLKTQAQREHQILRVFESSPALALGPVSLRSGINPTRTPLVTSADFTQVAGTSINPPISSGESTYFRVRVTRTTEDAKRPLLLTYFFSPSARLDRLEIARTIDGKLFRTRAEFDPTFFNDNFLNDQSGTDDYVYDWAGPEPK